MREKFKRNQTKIYFQFQLKNQVARGMTVNIWMQIAGMSAGHKNVGTVFQCIILNINKYKFKYK